MPLDSLKAVVPRITQEQCQERDLVFAYRAVTVYGSASQRIQLTKSLLTFLEIYDTALQPRQYCYHRFGLLPFRSPLLREYLLVSFPPGTEMFHFPGCASHLTMDLQLFTEGVSPFGHFRIKGC